MCSPALVGPLMIAGTAVQTLGQLQSGLYASRVAGYQAKVADQNKQLERESAIDAIGLGQEDQRRLGRDVAATVGSQTARIAGNNVDITVGSAARTIEDTKMIGREDSQTLAENVRRQVKGFQINSWAYESEKRARQAERRQALVGTAFGAASTALGSAVQYAGFRNKFPGI